MLTTIDRKMIELRSILKQTGKIKFYYEFLNVIGMDKDNFTNIKNGNRSDLHFTINHVERAIKGFGVNANFIFGFSDIPFREKIIERNNIPSHSNLPKPKQ